VLSRFCAWCAARWLFVQACSSIAGLLSQAAIQVRQGLILAGPLHAQLVLSFCKAAQVSLQHWHTDKKSGVSARMPGALPKASHGLWIQGLTSKMLCSGHVLKDTRCCVPSIPAGVGPLPSPTLHRWQQGAGYCCHGQLAGVAAGSSCSAQGRGAQPNPFSCCSCHTCPDLCST
jgi:hypothetical protein